MIERDKKNCNGHLPPQKKKKKSPEEKEYKRESYDKTLFCIEEGKKLRFPGNNLITMADYSACENETLGLSKRLNVSLRPLLSAVWPERVN